MSDMHPSGGHVRRQRRGAACAGAAHGPHPCVPRNELAYLLARLLQLALPIVTSLALDLNFEVEDFSDFLAYLSSPPPTHYAFAIIFAPRPPPPHRRSADPGSWGRARPHARRMLSSNLTALKITSVPANEAAVHTAYRQLDALTTFNLNAHFLDTCWVLWLCLETTIHGGVALNTELNKRMYVYRTCSPSTTRLVGRGLASGSM
ncbi:hypothetical protein BC628DRAFT_364331 [Trametes gibbosa]|nr:hypothetical protein BC628DRAFT_364331 [Trametes gibbosa]